MQVRHKTLTKARPAPRPRPPGRRDAPVLAALDAQASGKDDEAGR